MNHNGRPDPVPGRRRLTGLCCVFQMKDSLVQELQQKAEETELLQMELQMLETERVRLSLVEEKLVDILQLLQQLRDLVSHRVTAWLSLKRSKLIKTKANIHRAFYKF